MVRPIRFVGVGLVALLWPSGAIGVFDGLPLDTLPEFASLAVLLCLAFRPARWSRAIPPALGRGALALAVVAVVLKSILFLSGAHSGFPACYRPLLGEPGQEPADEPAQEHAQECARSWRNPFRLAGATRFDDRIAFHAHRSPRTAPAGLSDSTWNLSMFNDNAFNFSEWELGVRVRERLPFSAAWALRGAAGATLHLRYVGELTLTVDGRPRRFPPAYDEPATARLALDSSARDVHVRFRFDDGSVQPWEQQAPYAMLEVRDERGPLASPGAGLAPRALSAVADLAVLAIAVGALVLLGGVLRAHALPLLAALVTALAAWLTPLPDWMAMLALAAVAARRDRGTDPPPAGDWRGCLPAAFAGSVVVAVVTMLLPRWQWRGLVMLRGGGEDFLTYESHARAILNTGSLHGGEDIFVYSPGFRYVLAALRLLIGEGDLLTAIAGSVVLVFAAVVLVVRFLPPVPVGAGAGGGRSSAARAWGRYAAGLLAAALLFALLDCDHVAFAVWGPLSEWPTWAALLLAIPLLFGGGRRAQFAACVVLGVAFTVRAQQAPALLALFVLFAWSLRGQRGAAGHVLRCAAAVAAIACLPALHNVVYGGELVFLPRTPPLDVNFPLSPQDLLRLGDDAEVRRTLADQVAGVLYLMPRVDVDVEPVLLVLFRGAQLVWLGAVCAAVAGRVRRGAWPPHAGLLLLPVAYLLPHVFLQVYVYYPRHIVAGHLALLASALPLLDRGARAPTRSVSS
jgi:hypothetical protein